MYRGNEIYFKDENKKWYPLENDVLPAKIMMPNWKTFQMDEVNIKKQKWQEYSKLTLLGYRGELLREDLLKDMPKVYYDETED